MKQAWEKTAQWWSAVIGLLATCYLFYPGYMSYDSVLQLTEARTNHFGQWYPPAMAWLWKVCDLLIPGPFGMLLLQATVYWAAWALLSSALWKKARTRFVFVLIVGFCPPLFGLLSTIWKDVGMAVGYLGAFALLIHTRRFGGRWALWGAVPLILYAFLVRHNSPPSALPAIFLWMDTYLRARQSRLSWLRSGAWTSVVFVAMIALNFAIMHSPLVSVDNRYHLNPNLQAVFIHDIALMERNTGRRYFPSYLTQMKSEAVMKKAVNESFSDNDVNGIISFTYTPNANPHFHFTRDAAESASLKQSWWRMVREHPRDYLRHRWVFITDLISLRNVFYPFHYGIQANDLGVVFHERPANRWMRDRLDRIKSTRAYRAWIYLLGGALAMLLALLVRRRRWRMEALLVGASGFFYLLPLGFILGSCDYRYILWPVMASIVCVSLQVSAGPLKGYR